MKNKLTGILFSLVIFIAMISCKVGLGEIVDLVAPEITVEEMVAYNTDGSIADTVKDFGTAVYTKKNVTFSGKATDNVEVTKVYAEIKLNDSDYTYLKTADISGEKWTLDISFEKEGACWLKIVACDKNENYGTKANKVVTLFVDETAPKADDWYIDRQINGIQYKLKSLQDLKNILEEDKNLSNPSNKDVAQNGDFLICASFDDAAGIKSGTTSISIYDENGNKVVSGIEVDSSSTSDYAPKFKIDGEIHNLAKTGKNYYQVRYSSSDIIPDSNSVKDIEVSLGWFLWWPESDMPRCSITDLEENASSMSIRTGDSLNITVFDDDALKGDITCKLKGDNPSNDVTETKTINSDTERECNIIVKAPDKPQTMTLEITAEDKNGKPLNTQFTVYVTDEFKPSVIFTSPENNQIPAVNGNEANITFAGIALDKVVCNFLEIIWVPDSVTIDATTKRTLAQNWFNSIDYSKKTPVADEKDYEFEEGTGDYAGLKKWSAKLKESEEEEGFKKYEFNFNIPLLEETGLKSEAKKDKYFFARVINSNDIYSESELKLTGDNLVPEIKAIFPAGNMAYIDGDLDLVIKFKGEKQSGLPMNIAKYSLKEDGNLVNGSYDTTEECYTYTVPKATLDEYVQNNKNPKFTYYVEDVLGNSASAKYQFIIDTLPVIQTVTSSASAKCKKGDEIYINVSFSKPIPITYSDDVKLKLRNIKNAGAGNDENTTVYADYSSGSGSTTLIFKYTVKEGDTSDGLQVYNEPDVGPIEGILETVAHLKELIDENNLQAKRAGNPITIDGVTPNVKSIKISTDSGAENKNNNISYLKAGRTVTATVITDKKVSVQGSPVIKLFTEGEGSKAMELKWQKTEDVVVDGKGVSKLIFNKKVTNADESERTYEYNTCQLIGSDVIKDDFGNSISYSSVTPSGENFVVDTTKPNKPVFYKENVSENTTLIAGKYKTNVLFSLSNGNSEDKIEYYDYNKKLVDKWTTYTPGTVEISKDVVLVARATDYAGNVSDYTEQLDVMICNTFPTYTIECTNADGFYKYDKNSTYDLTFKVNFSREVTPPGDVSNVYVSLSAGTGTTPSNPKASYYSAARSAEPVTSVEFTYKIQQTDEFTVKIAKDGVKLNGFKDLYGNEWSATNDELTEDRLRPNLKCDGVPPTITRMEPQGDKTTQNGLNAYSNAKQIVLTFSEPVTAVSGNIYLRQTAGWAIPPMLTADEFNTVLSAVNSATIDTSKTYGLSGSEVLQSDGKEDAESLYGSTTGPANDRYHGTGQYKGPYKKMTNGVDNSGNPDLSVKYVLDFSMDIWGTEDSDRSMLTKYVGNEGYSEGSITEPRFGQTYETHATDDVLKYHHLSQAGLAKVYTPKNKVTTSSIRYVLEQVHFHERYMAVNSTYVTFDDNKKTVILNFPKGLLGDDALPLGREWELVIENGSFMDETGNKFGFEYDSSNNLVAKSSPSIIPDGANNSFMSAGVAKPVIRVDRYSYGLGIKQPKSINSEGVITYEKIDSIGTDTTIKIANTRSQTRTVKLQTGSTAPTAYVGVRIDTESKGAKVRYTTNIITPNTTNKPSTSTAGGATTQYSKTEQTLPANPTGEGSNNVVFLGGTGDYLKSCKQYIKADALYASSVTSEIAQEGIFQTVLDINKPDHNLDSLRSKDTNTIYNSDAGRRTVNIHGTTGLSGEPSISPYPLRDQALGSAYMKQTYQNKDQYYWISYEVLVDAGFSMYVFGQYGWAGTDEYNISNYKAGWGDWAKNYGMMYVGEFNKCTGLESWPGLSEYENNYIVPDNQNADNYR